jgi:hypothetical protein
LTREEIHKSMISLRFLDIIMRFLRLEVSIDFEVSFLPFYKMSFMNELEFSSFIRYFFVWISETLGVFFCQVFLLWMHFSLLFL